MKTILATIMAMVSFIVCHAETIIYNEGTASECEKKMVAKALEISQALGPDYHAENAVRIEISGPEVFTADDPRPEIQQNVGREFYSVIFIPEDPKCYEWWMLSNVEFWNNGEPKGVIFGNGYGFNFYFESFETLRDDPNVTRVPLQKVDSKRITRIL